MVAPFAEVRVSGAGVERAATAEVLGSVIKVALAMLAVTVVIAVVGIGNTLGLSVVERTRESALLRAAAVAVDARRRGHVVGSGRRCGGIDLRGHLRVGRGRRGLRALET